MKITRYLAAAIIGLGTLGLPPISGNSGNAPGSLAALFTAPVAEAGGGYRHRGYHRGYGRGYGHGKRYSRREYRRGERRYHRRDAYRKGYRDGAYRHRGYYSGGSGFFFGAPLTVIIRP